MRNKTLLEIRGQYKLENNKDILYKWMSNKGSFTNDYVHWLEREFVRVLNADRSNAKKHKSIDNVTTNNLDIAMRAVGISCDIGTIDKIIDLVELLEESGDNTTLEDIIKLQKEWRK